jgi:undecaprenyl diphosphate synthase
VTLGADNETETSLAKQLDLERLPRHVAIIMDGNGRWAERHGLTCAEGHEAGARSARAAIEACRETGGIQVLTLYAFSTENWRRSDFEINALFRLLSKYISIELDSVHEQDIRIRTMGRLEGLPKQARRDMEAAMERTASNSAMTVNVALNYGGRAEISDAAKAAARDVLQGKLKPEDVDENVFGNYLYNPDLPDPDLLIRTSGELRLSNFMLWQLAYAEILVLPLLWPDFRKEHFFEAIVQYQGRQRRYGGRKGKPSAPDQRR